MVIIVILTFSTCLVAQTNKPWQLRNEILMSKENADKSENAAASKNKTRTKRNPFGNVPPTGATILKPANPANIRNASLIKLEQSDLMMYDQVARPGVQILKGNVRFRQDNALLYCDSAYFYEQTNSFDAFSNVRIVQGDTLTVTGDFLNYDGNSKLAKIWNNVKLIDRKTTLTTSILYYDRFNNLAFYDTGGEIKDDRNTLTSMWGQYSPATKMALFKDQVKMVNPDFTMTSDTLKYNTSNSIADIVGKSHVIYKEDTDIYSQLGWYDTKNDRMMLLNRSLVEQKDGKTMIGDTIFYDKKNRYGEAFKNVELNDPKQKSTLNGNYVSYDEVKKVGLATNNALYIDWSTKDSLFLSADTLYSMKDSIATDTVAYNLVKAFLNVRFFRSDIQGMCDSLYYSTRDSVMYLRGLPVLWSDNNQMMGTKITAFTKNQKINKIHVEQSGIAIQRDSLNYFNQLSGKDLVAYLDSGELKRVNVKGNAETIYFPKDDKTKDYIGVNKTLSSDVVMYFKNKKVDRIVLTTASSGSMYPLSQMEEDDLYLPNFYWYDKERPQKMNDVFSRFPRVAPPKRPESKKRPSFPGEQTGNTASQNGGTNPSQPSNASGTNNNGNNGTNFNNTLNTTRNKIRF